MVGEALVINNFFYFLNFFIKIYKIMIRYLITDKFYLSLIFIKTITLILVIKLIIVKEKK